MRIKEDEVIRFYDDGTRVLMIKYDTSYPLGWAIYAGLRTDE